MPVFQGLVSEESPRTVAYVKTLNQNPSGAAGRPAIVQPARSRRNQRRNSNGHNSNQRRTRELSEPRKWHQSLFTTDHKRIALLYLLSITFFFFIRGVLCSADPAGTIDASRDLVQADVYNKLFTMHGQVMVFFFLIPSIPAVPGNFLVPLTIGARTWRFLHQSAELVSVHRRRDADAALHPDWRSRHRLDLFTPFSTAFSNTKVIEAGLSIFIVGFSIHLDRTELCSDHSPHAGAWMPEPPAPVHLVALRDQHHLPAGYAGAGDHAAIGYLRTGLPPWNLRPHAGWRPICCSNTCSGSIRTQRSTLRSRPPWAWRAR